MMKSLLPVSIAGFLLLMPLATCRATESEKARQQAFAQWRHSGSIFLLTTPDGADLPAGTVVENFPVLVRLHSDFFDFRQAQPTGADLRFSSPSGEALSHQIDEWDPEHGTAAIWVRVPRIEGNARQELRLHWGHPEARSTSDGAAVFNAANGYVGVFHLGAQVQDETGALQTRDTGTTPTAGIVGAARYFPGGRGVFAGDKIRSFPVGSGPHTTSAWFRCDESNARVLGWGNEEPQGKVILNFRSPPHVRMECYFSGADVASQTSVRRSEWIHVVHTYEKGKSLLYVDGVLAGETKTDSAPLKIRQPCRMWIGGWYDVYDFRGAVDEVRIANVTRSAEWARLEFENQKPLSTLVGPVVLPGNTFSVSPAAIAVREGELATVQAQTGGAEKIYWILNRGGRESVVAVDRLSYTLEAGRVAGDESATLQLRAVYADTVRTLDVPVQIAEELPEPVFTLNAPATWDGRKPIEVEARLENLAEMKSKGVEDSRTTWSATGLAVIKGVAPGKLILRRSQNSGRLTVQATVDNGGRPAKQTIVIDVREPARDPWVARIAEPDEKPVDGQFYARDDRNEGTLHCNGTLVEPAERISLRLYANDRLLQTEIQKPAADGSYAFTATLKPGLVRYKIELVAKTAAGDALVHTADNLLCGDAYVIEGQSNAVSTDWSGDPGDDSSEWVRSFGTMEGDTQPGWGRAVRREGGRWQIGYWGMDLAKRLVESQQVPICIINGAVGGTRVDQHQRNPLNPTDRETIFGRLLNRVGQARLTHGIRGVLWHQGEADQGADGPDGGYGEETYEQYFLDMAAAWKQEMPNIRHYHLFQIWPNACSQGGTRHSDRLRDIQRRLPRQFAHMSVMSTVGIRPEGSCHYPADGYAQMARLIGPLVERDQYGRVFDQPITAADLRAARYTSADQDEIELEFDQPMVWDPAAASQIRLDDKPLRMTGGSAAGNILRLQLGSRSEARKITYLIDRDWNPNRLLYGANRIAALTFCEVEIEPRD